MPRLQTIGRQLHDAIAIARGGVMIPALERDGGQALQGRGRLRRNFQQSLRIIANAIQVVRFDGERDQVGQGLLGIRIGGEHNFVSVFGFGESFEQLQSHGLSEHSGAIERAGTLMEAG